MNVNQKSKLLRRTLIGNAVFSALLSLVLLIAADSLAPFLGQATPWVLKLLAIGVLIFAIELIFIVRNLPASLSMALLVVFADIVWVIASIALLAVWPHAFTWEGKIAVTAVAVLVALFADLQLIGVLRTLRNDRPGPKQAVVFERAIPVSPSAAWEVVSDVDGYARYAPSIASSHVINGSGKGMVRECSEPKGGRWTEQCTLWQKGKGYGFVINTQAADYPFPFRELQGEWWVLPCNSGSLIRMRFELTMPWGILGEILLAATYAKYNADVQALLDNWEHALLLKASHRVGEAGEHDGPQVVMNS